MKREKKRKDVTIAGEYQYKAFTEGCQIQRFWHHSKFLAIQKFLPPRSGDFVLDVGCGSGVISGFLGESGADVLGIDTNSGAIQFATQRFASERVLFIQSSVVEPLPVDRPVDKIYCLELIEHMHRQDAGKMLELFYCSLKKDGKVFLTTPNYHSLWPVIEWMLDHSGLVPPMGGHQHVEPYYRKKLTALCREHGFRVDKIAMMGLFSPWLALLSHRMAERAFYLETEGSVFLPGPILVAVLGKG